MVVTGGGSGVSWGWCQAALWTVEGRHSPVALSCPLINQVFLVGWGRGGGLSSRPPCVIGVESGWRLLKCAEGPHFVVWGRNGAPRIPLGLLLLHSILCPSDDFCFGPRLFPSN